MTTDRSSLSMRSVFMYELRGETSRGECKEVSFCNKKFSPTDLGFGVSHIRNFSADSSGHACNTCTCTTGQARFPGPTAVSQVPNCQNCKSPGGPRSPRAAKLAHSRAPGKWMRRRFPLSPRRLKSTTHTGTYRFDKRTGQSRVNEGDGALPPISRDRRQTQTGRRHTTTPQAQGTHSTHIYRTDIYYTHNRIPTLICGFVNR